MPDIKPLPFAPTQESGIDPLAGATVVAHNVVLDGGRAVRRRPGLRAASGIDSGVVDAAGIAALHVTSDGVVWAVGGGSPLADIYRVGAASAQQLTVPPYPKLHALTRPVVAETEAILAIAAGAEVHKVLRSTGAPSLLGGSPPQATHVLGNAARLMLNDVANPSLVWFSGFAIGSSFAGHEQWTVGTTDAGFFGAESRPDPVLAIAENTNEIFAFGRTSVQVFAPDPTTSYTPVATRELGIAAPYSVVKRDQEFCWLDHLRRFVVSDGRSFDVLPDTIKGTIDGIDAVSDAIGYRFNRGSVDALVWSFPTDTRSFAFQGGGWGQWTSLNESGGWARVPVNCLFHDPVGKRHLVGTTDGRVLELTLDATDDMGTSFPASVTTGLLSRGADRLKDCLCVRLTLRREAGTAAEQPVALLSWRDDAGPWGQPLRVFATSATDDQFVVEFRGLGVYRRRQWKFEFFGAGAFVLAGAEEEFEILES
jgi:hypothetical protein